MSEFENILERTNEARNTKQNLEEYADELAKMIGIKINGIFERHQQDILALDGELRKRIKESLRKKFETSLTEVENCTKEMDL